MIDVKIKRLTPTATIPTYGSIKAAGMDLYADLEGKDFICINPHETVKIGTGWGFDLPEGYCAIILARSGMATKQGLAPANKIGLCDEDYKGNYIVPLHNHSTENQVVRQGDRIAQLMFVPYVQANLIEVDKLTETERGEGGFGSTGK